MGCTPVFNLEIQFESEQDVYDFWEEKGKPYVESKYGELTETELDFGVFGEISDDSTRDTILVRYLDDYDEYVGNYGNGHSIVFHHKPYYDQRIFKLEPALEILKDLKNGLKGDDRIVALRFYTSAATI
jgi:hypothetical protein